MKKAIAGLLSFILILTLSAVPVFAEEQATNEDYIEQIDRAIEQLQSIEPQNAAEEAANEKLVQTAEEFQDQLRYNPETIYDLNSIPARVELFVKLCQAMRFGTTEITNKIDAAHNKLASWITVGLLQTVNPFATIDDLLRYAADFDAIAAELLSYPDLGPDDSATIYVRAKLDDLLHKARFLKFNELEDKSNVVIDQLDRVILEVTGIRLKPQATVRDLDEATAYLLAAIEEAKASTDVKASRADIDNLRAAKSALHQAIRSLDNPAEARELERQMTKAILTIRVSKALVLDLIAKAQPFIG